jgi:hypothetical protein
VVRGGLVVVVAALLPDVDPDVDVDDEVGVVVGTVPFVLGAELAPGCSRATTTPITAMAAVAASTAERVSRRKSASARSREWGELWWGSLIGGGCLLWLVPMRCH